MKQQQSPAERERIREENAKVQEKMRKEFKPEPTVYTPWLYIRIDRATKGTYGLGLFRTVQFVNPENPEEKVFNEGVDIPCVEGAVRSMIIRRLNQRAKK